MKLKPPHTQLRFLLYAETNAFSVEQEKASGFVCSQVLFAVKTLGQSHSAGELGEKTFSVQFRLFGPVLQKGAICLGLALSPLFEGDGPFHVPDGRYFQKHK